MRWRGGRLSDNVIDKRASGGGSRGGSRGGGRARVGGIGGLGAVAIILVGWFFGVDLTPLLGGQQGGSTSFSPGGGEITAEDEARAEFSSVVLAFTEDVWTQVFRDQLGRTYEPPELVLFAGATDTACGYGEAATGPFYCPADERAYLDTDFFVTLDRQLGAEGDFAAAYVIAHEVAHHIQQELGILQQVAQARTSIGATEANALQVRVELQADCLAGIWARYAGDRFGILEYGDLDEALNAAAQIGDDTLAERSGRVVRPDSFTHGSSAQRQRWFATGYDTGQVQACDTFAARTL